MASPTITQLLGIYNVRDYGLVARATADNQGAIQAAVEAARAAGGGQVVIPSDAGVVGIGSTILLHDDIELVIPAGVTLRLLAGANADMIANADQVNGNSGVRVTGGGVIDGNRANQTGTSNGIKLVKCDDARVEVTVQNCYTDGLALVSSARASLAVLSRSNGRHGVYLAACWMPTGQVHALDNGRRVSASGLALDGVAGQGTTDASLLLAATDTQPIKTQQYGVIELVASGSDRNTIVGSAAGNVLGSASLVGANSVLVGGIVGGPTYLDGGTAVSVSSAVYDGGAAAAVATNRFNGGGAAG